MPEPITLECPIYAMPVHNEDMRLKSIYNEFGTWAFPVEGYR